jgi:hypothetical protein
MQTLRVENGPSALRSLVTLLRERYTDGCTVAMGADVVAAIIAEYDQLTAPSGDPLALAVDGSIASIDQLFARTDIVEVIGARVPLKRWGKEYLGRCPFHDERSPSLTVSPTKQVYRCLGCGANGTALEFLMNLDGLSFLEAKDALARLHEVAEAPKQARRSSGSRKRYAVKIRMVASLPGTPASLVGHYRWGWVAGAVATSISITRAPFLFAYVEDTELLESERK